jgi:hypothetical protein
VNSYRNPRANLVEEPTRYQSSPSFFVSARGADQTIPTGGATRVTFDTALINDNGCFNFGTSEFVCPKAGRMFLGGQSSVWNNNAGTTVTFTKISAVPSSLRGNTAMVGMGTLAGGDQIIYNGNFIVDVQVGTRLSLDILAFGNNLTNRVVPYGEEFSYLYGYYLI